MTFRKGRRVPIKSELPRGNNLATVGHIVFLWSFLSEKSNLKKVTPSENIFTRKVTSYFTHFAVHWINWNGKGITYFWRQFEPKIQQTKMLVTCQRFGDLFFFGLIWQYSSNHKTYNKGRLKVIATYLQQ